MSVKPPCQNLDIFGLKTVVFVLVRMLWPNPIVRRIRQLQLAGYQPPENSRPDHLVPLSLEIIGRPIPQLSISAWNLSPNLGFHTRIALFMDSKWLGEGGIWKDFGREVGHTINEVKPLSRTAPARGQMIQCKSY